MSQAESVAMWVGLITGISGTVLAIVTIWFALNTDQRSRDTTENMIRALQKIEAYVERSSSDTQGLIKMAWERMFAGQATQVPSPVLTAMPAQEIASGLAAELREDLAGGGGEGSETALSPAELDRRFAELVPQLSSAIASQVESRVLSSTGGAAVDALLETIQSLQPAARELVDHLLAVGHLTRDEYLKMQSDPYLAKALSEARSKGLITPLAGHGRQGMVVYWFPPHVASILRPAVTLIGPTPPARRREFATHLADVLPSRKLGFQGSDDESTSGAPNEDE